MIHNITWFFHVLLGGEQLFFLQLQQLEILEFHFNLQNK